MAAEKVDYRETLVWLQEQFGGRVVVSVSEVTRQFRIGRKMALKRYPFKDNKIEITRLASAMCLSAQDVRRACHTL